MALGGPFRRDLLVLEIQRVGIIHHLAGPRLFVGRMVHDNHREPGMRRHRRNGRSRNRCYWRCWQDCWRGVGGLSRYAFAWMILPICQFMRLDERAPRAGKTMRDNRPGVSHRHGTVGGAQRPDQRPLLWHGGHRGFAGHALPFPDDTPGAFCQPHLSFVARGPLRTSATNSWPMPGPC